MPARKVAFAAIGLGILMVMSLALLLVAVPALFFFAMFGVLPTTAITDRLEAQELARIVIPASARNLHCGYEHGMDLLVYGRFEIPAADLPQILNGMPADGRTGPCTGHSNVLRPMHHDWWHPELLRQPRMAEWHDAGLWIHLLFDDPDQVDLVTVYFFNFRT